MDELLKLMRYDKAGRLTVEADFTIDCERRLNDASDVNDTDVEPAAVVGDDDDGEDADIDASGRQPPDPANDGLVRQRWRFVSMIEAWPSGGFFLPQLIDMSHNNGKALQEAALLINRDKPPLMLNHSLDVQDEVGFVEGAEWENSRDIKPGVNGHLVVDPEIESKVAKKIEKGLFRNGSIGIAMKLLASHPKMKPKEFYEKQGQMINGNKVRWLLQKVHKVRHFALVPAMTGADPNAGQRTANINNQTNEKAPVNDQPKKQKPTGEGTMEENTKLKQVLTTAFQQVGVDTDCIAAAETDLAAEERLREVVGKLTASFNELKGLRDQVKDLAEFVRTEADLTLTEEQILGRLPDKLEFARYGESFLNEQQKKAQKLFCAVKGGKEDPKILNADDLQMWKWIGEEKDLQKLEYHIKEYGRQINAKFGSRRSTVDSELPDEEGISANPDQRKKEIRDATKKFNQEKDED